MNVLIVSHDLLFKENIVPYELLQKLRPDWNIKILVPQRTKMLGNVFCQLPETSLEIIQVPVYLWQKPQIQIYQTAVLRKLLSTWTPALVHLNQEPFNFASLEFSYLIDSLFPRPKFIIRSSMLDGVKVSTKIEPIFRWVEKKVCFRVDGIECINQQSLAYIRRHSPGIFSKIIPWSRDPEFFSPGSDNGYRQKLGLTRFTIGCFGNLTTQKDLPTLFRAVSHLKREGVEVQILVLGAGPEKSRLESLSKRLELEKNVVWHPPVPPDEIVPFYRCLDTFVLCSRTEGHSVEVFGRVLIEAMACGVPVVGSSSGAIPEVVGEGGLIFQEGDSAALAECIDKVVKGDWPSSRRPDVGRERFLSNFTHRKKAEKLIEFYQTVQQD